MVEYAYDPWGKPLETRILKTECAELAKRNPFRYRRYQFDEETGLYYLRSRYYNSGWGRFINIDSILGGNKDLFSFNLLAYCSNAPVIFSDPSGTEKVWERFGFKYDGTLADFHRLEQELPPLAYSRWIAKGGTIQMNKTVQKELGIKKVIKTVTYIPADVAKDAYIERAKALIGPDATDAAMYCIGAVTLIEPIARAIPGVGHVILLFETGRLRQAYMDKMDLDSYESVMKRKAGVLQVVWAIEGAPSGNGSWNSYHSWDGMDNLP